MAGKSMAWCSEAASGRQSSSADCARALCHHPSAAAQRPRRASGPLGTRHTISVRMPCQNGASVPRAAMPRLAWLARKALLSAPAEVPTSTGKGKAC